MKLPHRCAWIFVAAIAALSAAASAFAQPPFVAFESGHVRPLALSPDGGRLFAVNTPDNALEIFDVSGAGLVASGTVPVGMEPVAVAARTNTEVWVVNHLSDSVSIVDLAATPPRVKRTLLVGDEPRDIVFAGTGGGRAFITTAHRGQHRLDPSIAAVTGAGDPQLTTEGIGRADVWVFDATTSDTTIGGTPVAILSFFADTPRALAASPNGDTVYVAAFQSGNQTTSIGETMVPDGFDAAGPSGGAPGGVPGPADNADGAAAPETGLIVKFDGAHWVDAIGRNWDALVQFDLPDRDVFSIDADTLSSGSVQQFSGVGTVLFNMAVNPINGNVYVTNTELPNHVRFEGPGNHGGSTVQGHLSESRITVIDPDAPSVDPQHLNQHIDYSKLHTDVPDLVDASQIDHSLATPLQPVVSSDGTTLYLAAFGSGKIGVFATSAIEDANFETNFDPTVASANYIDVGGGPSGLAFDEANGRLYVMTRFANQVEVVDLATRNHVETHPLHNPEPASLVAGRPFLYDARITSGNGEASCSSCHIFGDNDGLAWNLGNPDDAVSSNPQKTDPQALILGGSTSFHPMKGPMTTQTLRGLATHGAMHWRGDRASGFFGVDPCEEATGSNCSEDRAFRNFIVAFEGLLGMQGTISANEMQLFADFALQLMLPPNPIRDLDNSLSGDAALGEGVFGGPTAPNSDTITTCDGCHDLNPAEGFFGTSGDQTFEAEPQFMKVAHMRNLYTKVGMFGQSTGGSHTGEQVRGFGLLHDGSVDTIASFVQAPVFNLTASQELQLEQFALRFPTDLAPIVGQQITLDADNGDAVNPRIDLMIERAGTIYASLRAGGAVPECDLVVKGSVAGEPRGWVRESDGQFRDDRNGLTTDSALRALAVSEGPLTYTCVPPGSGIRTGIDRDEDDFLDGLDNCPAAANPLQENFDADPRGDVCDPDDDNDGLLDVVETNTGVFVSDTDTGTDPFNADSDGDGVDDLTEVADPNRDPNINEGLPPVPAVSPIGWAILTGSLLALGSIANARRRRTSPPQRTSIT